MIAEFTCSTVVCELFTGCHGLVPSVCLYYYRKFLKSILLQGPLCVQQSFINHGDYIPEEYHGWQDQGLMEKWKLVEL